MIRARGVSRKGIFFPMKTGGSKRCLYWGGVGVSLLIFSGTELCVESWIEPSLVMKHFIFTSVILN